MKNRCLICDGYTGEVCLSFGQQVVTKNLVDHKKRLPFFSDLTVTICKDCGTVQLKDPWPYKELVPRYAWMTFREPEAHLDDVVSQVINQLRLDKGSLIAGISPKDDSTLARFERRGFSNIYRIDPFLDLGISEPNTYIESVQYNLTPEIAERIASQRGHADCVIARHILEHAERPQEFLTSIRALLKPNGFAIFEVPDCTDALDATDYALIWEEHSLYFTPMTLEYALTIANFKNLWGNVYPYPFENSIVVLANKSEGPLSAEVNSLNQERDRFSLYCNSFPESKSRVRASISDLCATGQPIVLFGAGHSGCSFVNYYELGGQIVFAVDDAPEKLGLRLPGSELEIRPSSDLDDLGVCVCLLAVTPEKESIVLERLQSRLKSDVTYKSIVSTSAHYIGKESEA